MVESFKNTDTNNRRLICMLFILGLVNITVQEVYTEKKKNNIKQRFVLRLHPAKVLMNVYLENE